MDEVVLAFSKQGIYLYTGIGGFFGVLKSFFVDNGVSIILTAVLGFTGALFGAFAKYFVDHLSKASERKLKLSKDERKYFEVLKRKEQEDLLLKREEELTKQGL